MPDRGGEFSSLQDILVRTDIRIDISISIRFMITKFGKEVHLQDLTQVRLIKHVLLTYRYYVKTTLQTKNISPLIECLRPPDLAGY